MADEIDRVAMVSDLRALESRLEKRLETSIHASADETRRHFDIMVEKVEAAVKLVAEVNSHHSPSIQRQA